VRQDDIEKKTDQVAEKQRQQADKEVRLANAQKQTAQQVSAVSSAVSDVKIDVGGVKTDLGAVKTDLGKAQNDLAAAVALLTSMKGELADRSSLIARNPGELEVLRLKGDRTFYEFSLVKGVKKPVGTVSLELKKADSKKSKVTIVVYADDKEYEKKDRNLNEPMQFYAGKDPLLFEIVVNTVGAKNGTVAGYLAVPKNAPVPVTAGR